MVRARTEGVHCFTAELPVEQLQLWGLKYKLTRQSYKANSVLSAMRQSLHNSPWRAHPVGRELQLK
jgi:hypothetical protein